MSSDFWWRKKLREEAEAQAQTKPKPITDRPKYMDVNGNVKWRVEGRKPRIKAKTPPQSR
jgi:hypothetical protein